MATDIYRVIRSKRRTLALEIDRNAELLVRAPYFASTSDIRAFVARNEGWIRSHMEKMERQKAEREAHPMEKIPPEQVRRLADLAVQTIPPRVEHFAREIGVTYGRITIRNQKTRWGSCSANGNLNFNCLLMLTPPDVQDYVIVHELCHRRQMNHSKLFWAEVEKILPDYRSQKKWLRDNGGRIIDAMVQGHETDNVAG